MCLFQNTPDNFRISVSSVVTPGDGPEFVAKELRKWLAKTGADRATLRYEYHRGSQDALRVRLRELAGSWVRFGYRRLTVLLKRKGWEVKAKRIYRLHTEEGLIERTKQRKERAQQQRFAQGPAMHPNEKWSMNFAAQRLADGPWIRVLPVVDQYRRVSDA